MPFVILAQNKPLVIEGVSPNFYLIHTVQAKENYYSIGRMYNISPKEIAPFNKLQLEKGLSLNQVIKIPLMEVNFLQKGDAQTGEVLIPLYHSAKEKEGLYRIGVNYNNLPLATLKQWNNIKGDAVPGGTKLIVGYLQVKPDLSSLASMAKTKPAETNTKEQAIVKKDPPAIKKETETAVVNQPVTPKETIAVKEPVTATIKKDTPVEITKEVEPENKPVATTAAFKTFNGGFFKTSFDKQEKKDVVKYETGSAAIFKSNSGWEDGKYYCLHNAATPGTIIKVTSVATGKAIYAKVLDVIPDIKQNNGLLIRISNSAAQELGIGDARFDCTLTYSK